MADIKSPRENLCDDYNVRVVPLTDGVIRVRACCQRCMYWKPTNQGTTHAVIDGECGITGNRTYPDFWCEDFDHV